MNTPLAVECRFEFRRRAKGRKQLEEAPVAPRPVVPPGRVPRVSRWMALALRFERLLGEGRLEAILQVRHRGPVQED